jgi:hypothetical protein
LLKGSNIINYLDVFVLYSDTLKAKNHLNFHKKQMARQFIILLITFCWTGVFGQTKIIYKQPQKVPKEKNWTLTSKMEPLIEVNEGTLNSGTLCNARQPVTLTQLKKVYSK